MKNIIVSTNVASNRTSGYLINNNAYASFHDPNIFQGPLLTGITQMPPGQEGLDHIWRDSDNLYYALGATDPDYCATLFTSNHGRWYEDFSKCYFQI